ncbi:flagellar biosynthetic protein FliO [Clostridium estertheticum]|uniref:flagellar biosynthetic protein FliO n=1 Tax=Clostridium estertheticum TaxID=238834 RepID=UPI001C0E82EB|nr:flagellar biosynthetic protein FliO [Clostridium estertheticum]MBU3186036.1 flagellar biosynthetic protein FliO [Clostridium estertheticum]MCB2340788.1 flagellar biosynthetic protein FliO [Clostridium estertheticum]
MLDKEFWIFMFKIIIFLPFILFMLYLSLKYGGTKLRKLQDGRYMRILDRISLSKENSIAVVKIGDKAYAVSSSLNDIKILFELPNEEIIKIEKIKELPQYEDMKDLFKKHILKKQTKEEVRYENKK